MDIDIRQCRCASRIRNANSKDVIAAKRSFLSRTVAIWMCSFVKIRWHFSALLMHTRLGVLYSCMTFGQASALLALYQGQACRCFLLICICI